MLVFWKPQLWETSLPPMALIWFDRSFVPLSNVISHDVQSSPLIEFLGPKYLALQWVSRDLSALDEVNFFLNTMILIALMMRNPNLSSEFLQHKVVQNYMGHNEKGTLKNRSGGYLVFPLQLVSKRWYKFCSVVKKSQK